jgi:hypothetical protein
MAKTADHVIRAAEEHLRTARLGLADLKGSNPSRRKPGLYNVIVFGRSATFALQNLRSIVPEFEAWYSAKQDEMKLDAMMSFFNSLRRGIEHQAEIPGGVITQITNFNSGDMHRFGPAPPGAISFFIGDENGGTGWEVINPDGTQEKYYVDLPGDIGAVEIGLANSPGGEDEPAHVIAENYLAKVGAIISEARERFIRKDDGKK